MIFTAVAAAAISVGSCVLNDWFDIELDRVNKVMANRYIPDRVYERSKWSLDIFNWG